MISISLDPGGLHRANNAFLRVLDHRIEQGLDATLESIAARAKQTTKFTDRTSALRNSIQSDGATGSFVAGRMEGVVSYAARSEKGYLYGAALEYGTAPRTSFRGFNRGITEKRFIRDAIDQEFGGFLEQAVGAAFRDAGFEVSQ